MALYIIAGGLGWMGYCCTTGGQASANNYLNDYYIDSHNQDSAKALAGGYGFACFCFILASMIVFGISIWLCSSSMWRYVMYQQFVLFVIYYSKSFTDLICFIVTAHEKSMMNGGTTVSESTSNTPNPSLSASAGYAADPYSNSSSATEKSAGQGPIAKI